MASGNPVIQVLEVLTPATLGAEMAVRAGGSTPVERVTVYAFDAATVEYIDYKCILRGYGGGGITLLLPWSAAAATSGVTRWAAAFRRMTDDAVDIDASHTYDYNEVDDTAASASGELSMPTITFTNGSDMDSLAEGEVCILRVKRNASHANDTMTGDAELWGIDGKET